MGKCPLWVNLLVKYSKNFAWTVKIWLGIQKTFNILFVTGSFDGCPSFEIPNLGIILDLQLSHYCDHWEENELLQEYWVFLFNAVQFSTFLLNLQAQ